MHENKCSPIPDWSCSKHLGGLWKGLQASQTLPEARATPQSRYGASGCRQCCNCHGTVRHFPRPRSRQHLPVLESQLDFGNCCCSECWGTIWSVKDEPSILGDIAKNNGFWGAADFRWPELWKSQHAMNQPTSTGDINQDQTTHYNKLHKCCFTCLSGNM